MIRITYWAHAHVWTSRLIIIFLIYPLLNITGWFLGDLLAFNNIDIQSWAYPLCFFILFLFVVYPFNSDRHRYKYYYTWKKTIDVLMICTTFCFILMRGNSFSSDVNENNFVTAGYAANGEKIVDPQPASKIKKEKKNFIKKFVKDIRKKYRNGSKSDKTGMIILAIFVALLAIVLLGMLTCSIACSGAEALAYVLFIIGMGAIIYGLLRVIRRISNGPKKPEPVKEPVGS
ncbi:MAG: hypothetical protein ACJ749_02370 [Flavisolibacter sp.]